MKLYQNGTIWRFIEICIETAKKSTCLRSKCGAIIVKDDIILGSGWNSPPNDIAPTVCRKDSLSINFKSDKTCCIHAEQRAILSAIANQGLNGIQHSTLYFVRLNKLDTFEYSGAPYCTICSKLFLEVAGVEGKWILGHTADIHGIEGFYEYNADEYNELSFQYNLSENKRRITSINS